MRSHFKSILLSLLLPVLFLVAPLGASAQIDMDQVIKIGKNAIYFKDYVLAIQLLNNAVRTDSTRAEPYYFRAVAKYQLDDYRGAEADATRSIELNPFIYDAYYLRGISRHTLGKDSLATLDYEQVLSNNPDHKGSLHNLSALYISSGDTLRAQKTINHLRRYFPSYAMTYVLDGGLHLVEKDTVAAERLFREALSRDATLAGAYLSLAEIEYNRSRYQEAERLITGALRQLPRESRLYVNRALMRYKQNNIRGAMSDYDEAVKLDPTGALAHYNRALLRTQVGELNGALEDFNVVIKQDPNNYFAIFNRAIVSNLVGDPGPAKNDLDRIIKRYPTFVPAYAERSNAYRLMGQDYNARKDLHQASKMVYDRGSANQAKALQEVQEELEKDLSKDSVSLAVRDEKDENIRKFRQLVINSQNKGYTERFIEDGTDGTVRGRVQDREQEVKQQPLFRLSYYALTEGKLRYAPSQTYIDLLMGRQPREGKQLFIVGETPELNELQTEEHLREAEKKESDPFHRAMALFTIKDYAEAVKSLNEVIEKNPQSSPAYFQRGVARFTNLRIRERQGEGDKPSGDPTIRQAIAQASISDFEKVLDLVPNYAPALYNIGYVYYAIGRYVEAEKFYRKAVEAAPDMGVAYFNLGLCRYALGDKTGGDNYMSRAGALGVYDAYSVIKRMQ